MTGLIGTARALRDRHRYKGPTVKGTRKRALPMIGIGFVAVGTMYQLVSANVLAVNFTTTDHQFKIYSNYIQGEKAGGFLATNKGYSSTGQVGVAELGIKTAKLAGLCAIAQEDLPIGHVSLVITAGIPVKASFDTSSNTGTDGAGDPITFDSGGLLSGSSLSESIAATDLFINTDLLTGYGNLISGLNLGQNAADTASQAQLNNGTGTWPTGQTPPTEGNFGLTAEHLNVGGLDGSTYGINLAGNINLPHLKITVQPGTKTQADCQTQATS